ncbi:MAG TPA: hypothetical protein VH419_01985 [Nocardioidaceae bacterium]|jgi:hypothetical protein
MPWLWIIAVVVLVVLLAALIWWTSGRAKPEIKGQGDFFDVHGHDQQTSYGIDPFEGREESRRLNVTAVSETLCRGPIIQSQESRMANSPAAEAEWRAATDRSCCRVDSSAAHEVVGSPVGVAADQVGCVRGKQDAATMRGDD